ncbi:uncharacterized protein METZ01_LOCUS32214 [marine metagenome]|uniref:Uncharacterized protein n=1 Tax=marine metagenome TaxID=408172 RepID=A0A381QK52_9ZZZZ
MESDCRSFGAKYWVTSIKWFSANPFSIEKGIFSLALYPSIIPSKVCIWRLSGPTIALSKFNFCFASALPSSIDCLIPKSLRLS